MTGCPGTLSVAVRWLCFQFSDYTCVNNGRHAGPTLSPAIEKAQCPPESQNQNNALPCFTRSDQWCRRGASGCQLHI